MSKNTLMKGTIILTLSGFATRLLGFFYRIYLSNALGAENLGIYQLVFPIYSICFTLYASGLQTAASKLVAAQYGNQRISKSRYILKLAISLSLGIALLLFVFVYQNASWLAVHVLLEPRGAECLKVLAFAFPFCGVTACINGYYYGLKQAGIPGMTQLLEQLVRIASVYVIAMLLTDSNSYLSCEIAVLGIVCGEIASNLFNLISLLFHREHSDFQKEGKKIYTDLAKLAFPITGNRLVISILHSLEAVMIPAMLRRSGLSSIDSLSLYGTLNGMSLPFIMFPSTITNSLSVMLLPAVSEAHAKKNETVIGNTIATSIKYSLLIGILSAGIFILFGNSLGEAVFHNSLCGQYLTILAWLCPFMYLSTTLGSIITGLGKAHLNFFHTIIGLSIRILFIIYLVPLEGIQGYLIGLLISQLIMTALDTFAVFRLAHVPFEAFNWIFKPAVFIFISGKLFLLVYQYIKEQIGASVLILLGICAVLCMVYLLLLFFARVLRLEEFKA